MNSFKPLEVVEILVNSGVMVLSETLDHGDHQHLVHNLKWKSVFAGLVIEGSEVWFVYTGIDGDQVVATLEIEEDDTAKSIANLIAEKLLNLQLDIEMEVLIERLFDL